MERRRREGRPDAIRVESAGEGDNEVGPFEAQYELSWGANWRTRAVRVAMAAGGGEGTAA